MKPIRTNIDRVGQPYVDEPVNRTVSMPDPLAERIAQAYSARVPQPIEELSHYDRVPLRWMRPDGNGGFIPRKNAAQPMWRHYCHAEKSSMGIERGQSCNWCGAKESQNTTP